MIVNILPVELMLLMGVCLLVKRVQYQNSNTMKYSNIIAGVLFALVLSCKQKPETKEPEVELPKQEVRSEKQVTSLLFKLAHFVNPTFSDITGVHDFFHFKAIDVNGAVQEINANRALSLYGQMTKNKEINAWPIFEVNGTTNVMLPFEGIGFGGAIWAKVLVDKKTLEIKKIEFNHKDETEGYGDAMTQSVFEERFIGTKIDLDKNTFSLKRNMEKRLDDGVEIDGIAGATMTSESIIEMLNDGLHKYRAYFNQYQSD